MIAKKCMKKWNSALDFLKKYKCNKIKQVPYQSNCNESPNAISFLFVFQLLCFEFPFFFFWTEFFLKYILSFIKNLGPWNWITGGKSSWFLPWFYHFLASIFYYHLSLCYGVFGVYEELDFQSFDFVSGSEEEEVQIYHL